MSKRELATIVLAVGGLLTMAGGSDAQVYRWDARVYQPYAYGPAYYYGQTYGLYRPSHTVYPRPFYTYRYYVTPGYVPPPAYYNNPYLNYFYSVPGYSYYWSSPSSVYLPY